MQYSSIGQHFNGPSGIVNLMDDLGNALAQGAGDIKMLGGGNPAIIPEVSEALRLNLQDITNNPDRCAHMLTVYDPPEGHPPFREALAQLLNDRFGWPLTKENIFISNGSQGGFFLLFNMIADSHKQIQLPLVPEYIGYADLGLNGPLYHATRPQIDLHGDQRFKYRVDFDALQITQNAAAICVSRPTNPTGNVLTDDEVRQLSEIAKQNNIPLILDNAYGLPFPRMIFNDAQPFWDEHVILCMSLSKFGIPSTRTGIVIAKPQIVTALGRANTIAGLSAGSVGPELGLSLIENDQLIQLSNTVIRPFYKRKMQNAVSILEQGLSDLPCRIHEPEGAMFIWLWCDELPITSRELYQRLKARNVLVIPGEDFFPGLNEPNWKHQRQCLRISYAQDDAIVEEGLTILCEEVRQAYTG